MDLNLTITQFKRTCDFGGCETFGQSVGMVGIFEQVLCQSQKSGIRAAGLVLSGGNMAAEVEMEYNHMFANAINIPSQKSEGVRHRWLESCGNLDKTDAGRKIIARLLPSHPRYKLLPAQRSTHGSR